MLTLAPLSPQTAARNTTNTTNVFFFVRERGERASLPHPPRRLPGPPKTMADIEQRKAALAEREKQIEERLERLEAALFVLRPKAKVADSSSIVGGRWTPVGATQKDLCPRHSQLRKVLADKSFVVYRFCVVPSDYYEQNLDFRRGRWVSVQSLLRTESVVWFTSTAIQPSPPRLLWSSPRRKSCLQAASLAHLCKTIMLESSAGETVTSDITTSKYILAVIQVPPACGQPLLPACCMPHTLRAAPSVPYRSLQFTPSVPPFN